VKKGDVVRRGQVIGQMGRSGKSTGVHLHFEVWKDGKRINPIEYLENYTEPTPAPPFAGLQVGDTVTYSGRLHGDSAGGNPGKTVSGTYTVSRVLEGRSHGVLLNDGLGWVRAEDCLKQGATAPEPPKPAPEQPPAPAPLKVGDRVRYSGRLYGNSSGGGAGKTVDGTYTVTRILSDKSHGVLLNGDLGWVPEKECKRV
jgi:hypothetical protein